MMSNEQCVEFFDEHILAGVIAHYGADDTTAIAYEFGIYIDGLCKDGEITNFQYENYTYYDEDEK